MTDKRAKILETVAQLTESSVAAEEYLESLIRNPITPPAMREEFITIQVLLNVQSYAIRTMNELNLEMEDHVKKLLETLQVK